MFLWRTGNKYPQIIIKYSKILRLRPLKNKTTPLLRPAFVSPMFSKVSDKIAYANNVDPDQTAPSGSTLIRVYTVCHSFKYFKKQLHESKNLAKKKKKKKKKKYVQIFRTFTIFYIHIKTIPLLRSLLASPKSGL